MDKYIIITPAKNEEANIEKTIDSVICQTVLPSLWVIVDDGSSDSTSTIVNKYVSDYPFIKLIENSRDSGRNFGNKVYAIRRGFEEIKGHDYDYYCNIDADVSFSPNYFETLIQRFKDNPKLGICGGQLYDLVEDKFLRQKSDIRSVGGPVQFFRRECYESIGGYRPFKSGFIDGFAEISARMKGWETRTFPELKVKHYRPPGTAKGGSLKILFESGKFHYRFGYSYFFHLLSAFNAITRKPYLFGTLAILLGYINCSIHSENRVVEQDFIKYLRAEQWSRIKRKIIP